MDYFIITVLSAYRLIKTKYHLTPFIRAKYIRAYIKMSLDVNISEPDEFDCTELHDSIMELASLKRIENLEYHVEYIYGKGDNYVANIFRVMFKDSGQSESTSVIVKTFINKTRQLLFHELHKREVVVYTEVLPMFDAVQKDLAENKVLFPKYLLAKADIGSKVLILEDLLITGFEVNNKLPKYEIPDLAQAKLILNQLAKFHALSFICEGREIEKFNNVKNKLEDLIFQAQFLDTTNLRNYFFESYEMSFEIIEDVNAKKMLQLVKPKILELLQDFLSPKSINVLCHGDFWINNMLFKNKDGKPNELCFIDFQTMRYTSPASDIIYFLYLCTDSNFRKSHFQDLIECYYQSLKSFLDNFDIDVDTVYRRDELDDINKYLPFGLLIALIELSVITLSIEEEANNMNQFRIDAEHDTNILFKARVNDVVTESTKNGVLDELVTIIKR